MSSVLVALRRLRDDRAPAIGLFLLVLVTAAIFGLAPRVLDRVADQALQQTVAKARSLDRTISLLEQTGIAADPGDPLANIADEGDRLDARMPASIRGLVSKRHIVVDSARFELLIDTADTPFVRFRVQPGALDRVRFVEGGAPAASTETAEYPAEDRHLLPNLDPQSTEKIMVPVLQIAIAADAAHATGLKVGELAFLITDQRDPLASRQAVPAAVRITGIYEASDDADPFWYDDMTLNHVAYRSLGGDSLLIDVGGLLAVDAYDQLAELSARGLITTRIAWRHDIDPSRLSADRLPATIVDLRKLETTFPQTDPGAATLTDAAMRSGLLTVVLDHANRWASATAILTVVAIGPAAVAVAALALVATLAARRRRPALAIVRGRGGTLGQIVRAVFLEGCVIVVPAVGLAIAIASVALPAASPRATILAATVVGLCAVALLILTALSGVAAAARGSREDDPAPRAVSARRLVFDLLVIVLAGGGAWLLRERGVRGTSSTGSLASADPFIAAVPALAGIAAGLAAIRLVRIPLRVVGALAGRARGLVPMLALRRAALGGTTAAVLLVLLATASIGTFSSAALVHLERTTAAASWHEVGAPIRTNPQLGSFPITMDPAKLPGVRQAAAMSQAFVQLPPRNLRVAVVTIDLAAYESIAHGQPGDPAPPPEMFGQPDGGVIPVLVSANLLGRPDGVTIGRQFEIVDEGYHFQFRAVGTREAFPTIDPKAIFIVASRQQMQAVHPEIRLLPTTLFLDAPDDQAPAILAAVQTFATGSTLVTRSSFAAAFSDSPVTAAISAGIAIAAIVAAAYAALAVSAALALAGAARQIEVAQLRTIGLSRANALALVVIEHGPTVLLAFLAGVALGLGLFVLLEPSLGIDAIVGSRLDVPLSADPNQLALTFVGVLAIAVVGIGMAAWAQRRGSAVLALRRGVE
ncbi:MAG TPA: FtsX-like permease family protein [Candidatus Limnocylindrales bacterium]|nr:FtsX-like permease family protein [Candidatus Limnocylindrales bacterium]